MSNHLPSHRAKLGRAQAHLNLPHHMEKSLLDGDNYTVSTERDSKTGKIIVYGEPSREAPIPEWGVVIDDIVHNLRSALDHLVWQLTLAEGHVPPPTVSGKWRRITFPIFVTDPRRKDSSGNAIPWRVEPPDSLWGINPSLGAEFEDLQPFKRKEDSTLIQVGMGNPAYSPLAILHDLWNIDKHRHINLAVFNVGFKEPFGPPPIPRIPKGIDRQRFDLNPKGSFEGRTEFGTFSWDGGPVPRAIARHLKPTVFFDVAFADGPPAYGGHIYPTLDAILGEVASVLERFERHLA
jgi:hypothetical protein